MRKCLGIFQGFKNATLFSVTMCSDADADNSGVVPGDRVSTQQPGLLWPVSRVREVESLHTAAAADRHSTLCCVGWGIIHSWEKFWENLEIFLIKLSNYYKVRSSVGVVNVIVLLCQYFYVYFSDVWLHDKTVLLHNLNNLWVLF